MTYRAGPRQGYGRDYGARQIRARDYDAQPLTDDEFYSRVNRW